MSNQLRLILTRCSLTSWAFWHQFYQNRPKIGEVPPKTDFGGRGLILFYDFGHSIANLLSKWMIFSPQRLNRFQSNLVHMFRIQMARIQMILVGVACILMQLSKIIFFHIMVSYGDINDKDDRNRELLHLISWNFFLMSIWQHYDRTMSVIPIIC